MKNTSRYEETAHLLKVIAHPTRLKILSRLRQHEYTVHEIQEYICCRQANLSQHLSLLRREHLVKTRREGKKVIYSNNFTKYKILENILLPDDIGPISSYDSILCGILQQKSIS